MRFESPNLLWLLLVVPPALASFFWWASRSRQKLLAQFIQARLLSALTVGVSPARRKIRFALVILAVVLLIVVLARPQQGFDLEQVQQRGLDIVVAVDTSKSMLATDIAPNRLARAKLAALELMQRADTDRLGLVAFAGDALLECPLTIDNTAFQQSVQALDVNSIPQGGTALAAAMNAPLLLQIAGATGGFYLPLRGADTMDTLYDRGLAPLPKSESQEKLVRRYHEQFHWPLAAAMVLLLVEIFLPERSLRTATKSKVQSPKPKVGAIVALVAILFLPVAVNASPSSALHDYQTGNYTNALQEFSQLAEIHTNDLRFVFNAGAAAYRATNYDEALKNFQQAALSPDLKLQQQAFYNLGNVQFQKAKQAKDLDGLEQGFDAAAKIYERAVMLNTNDVDAVFNLNLSKNAAEYIRQIKAALARGKSSADVAVRRAEFHTALEIMQSLTQKYKIAGKQFEEFTKKLKDIDDIATPHQP